MKRTQLIVIVAGAWLAAFNAWSVPQCAAEPISGSELAAPSGAPQMRELSDAMEKFKSRDFAVRRNRWKRRPRRIRTCRRLTF